MRTSRRRALDLKGGLIHFKSLNVCRSLRLNILNRAPCLRRIFCLVMHKQERIFILAQRKLESEIRVHKIYKQLRILKSLIRSRISSEDYQKIKKQSNVLYDDISMSLRSS